jgi:hypothetical protein
MHFHARKQRQGSRNNRHSLRNGLRLIRDLLGVPGFRATVASRLRHARLDPSVGGSGPHDFAVRLCAPRHRAQLRPSHPAPRQVTIGRNAPLAGRDGRNIHLILSSEKANYFRDAS